MRIAIPILGFGRSGGARVLSRLADEWQGMGQDVFFICPDSSEAPYFPTAARIIWVNGRGERQEAPREPRPASTGRYNFLSIFLGLAKFDEGVDVVLANQSLTAWPVALVSPSGSTRMYYVQAYEPGFYLDHVTPKNLVLAFASALTYYLPLYRVVNAPLYFRYKNLSAVEFVPPGLDLRVFHPSRGSGNRNDGCIHIGCIGRKEPNKGTVLVLEAFELLSRQDERFRLKVAYGNLPAGWTHRHCEIVTPKNDQELAEFYRGLDVLVAPGTAQHGAPHYPVLEAGACGIPVVTTGFMGASENTAWIVQNKNVESIAEGIRSCIGNVHLRESRRQEFLLHTRAYSWPVVARKMLDIIERQVSRNKDARR